MAADEASTPAPAMNFDLNATPDVDISAVVDAQASAGTSVVPAGRKPWECEHCTTINAPSNVQCDVCTMPHDVSTSAAPDTDPKTMSVMGGGAPIPADPSMVRTLSDEKKGQSSQNGGRRSERQHEKQQTGGGARFGGSDEDLQLNMAMLQSSKDQAEKDKDDGLLAALIIQIDELQVEMDRRQREKESYARRPLPTSGGGFSTVDPYIPMIKPTEQSVGGKTVKEWMNQIKEMDVDVEEDLSSAEEPLFLEDSTLPGLNYLQTAVHSRVTKAFRAKYGPDYDREAFSAFVQKFFRRFVGPILSEFKKEQAQLAH